MIEKAPAIAAEEERAVIGAMLIGPEGVRPAMDILAGKDFYSLANRVVFEAACVIAARTEGLGVDMVAVGGELSRTGKLGEVGGRQYLAECQGIVATTEHAADHARAVLTASLVRQIDRQLDVTAQDKTDDNYRALGELFAAKAAVFRSSLFEFRRDLPPAIEALLKPKTATALSTGLPSLDKRLGHLKPGDLITVGARTGVGKTALMSRLAVAYAAKGSATLYATTEMSEGDMLTRILPMALNIEAWRFRANRFEEHHAATLRAEAKGALSQLPLSILGRPRLALSDIRSAVNESSPTVVFVDYLQRCKFPKAESYPQAITNFMADLKTMAQESRVVIFIGCQLSRLMDKMASVPPTLADLKDSSGIEAESDVVCLLWKPPPEMLIKRTKPVEGSNIGLDLIIAKHRHSEQGMAVELELEAKYVKMLDAQEIKPNDSPEFL